MHARILLTLNNSFISEHALKSEVTTIGRRPENDIVVDNLAVSGRHARILLIGEEAFLEDLKSTNGTYLNSARVAKKF